MTRPPRADTPSDAEAAAAAVEAALAARRAQDAALILPLIGAVLVGPPAAVASEAGYEILGVPLIALYMFAVWSALILCAFLLARRLARLDDR